MAQREYKVRTMIEPETLQVLSKGVVHSIPGSEQPHIEDHSKGFTVRARTPDEAKRLAEQRLAGLKLDVRSVRHSPDNTLTAMVRRAPLKG